MPDGENEDSRGSLPPDNVPGPSRVYLLSLFVEYVFYRVDQFIEEHGLERVVELVKDRRWVLEVLLALLMIAYYSIKMVIGLY